MLNISFIDAGFVILNLIVLFLLMRKFLFGPVTKMIESRQRTIENNLATAEAKKAEAEEILAEYNGKMAEARQEAQELLQLAKSKGEREYQTIVKSAQRESQSLIASTQEQLEAEREEMLAGVRGEVATLALLAAAKVSSQKLDDESDAILVDSFLHEVGERP